MLVVLAVKSTVMLVRRMPSSTGLRTNRANYYGTSYNCRTSCNWTALGMSTLGTVSAGVGYTLLGCCGWLWYIAGNIGPDTMDINLLLHKSGLLDSNITVGMGPDNTIQTGSLGIKIIFGLSQ